MGKVERQGFLGRGRGCGCYWSLCSVSTGSFGRGVIARFHGCGRQGSTAGGEALAECKASRKEAWTGPEDRHGPTLPETACSHPALHFGTTPLPSTQMPLHSSPSLPSTVAIIDTVAGRMALPGERPVHTKGLVPQCPIPKQLSGPTARGDVFWIISNSAKARVGKTQTMTYTESTLCLGIPLSIDIRHIVDQYILHEWHPACMSRFPESWQL